MNLRQSKLYTEDLETTLAHAVDIEKLYGKKVLITGATGTIGSFAADALIHLNQKVKANIRVLLAGRSVEKLQNQFGNHDNVKYLSYDLNAPIEFDEAIDYVIHAAGNAHPAAFNGDPVGTIVGNIDSTHRLLEYMKNHGGKRCLYVSSGEVYGQGDISLDAFDETYSGYLDILSARSCYPLSKRMTENLCVSYWKQYDIESVIVRPCHTYGPFMTPSDNRAHTQFLHNALSGEDVVMKSAGTQMRSYNYVADCVAGLLTVLVNGNVGEAYNLANPKVRVTIAEFAEKIATAEECKVIFDDPTEADVANRSPIPKQILATEKLESLGWQPAFSIDLGIRHTLDILKEM
ncbi:MAG: NAD-dependent epimerase/dehydratase family protein [Faecalibacterium prausnitzii]|jgi:UDP-glucuronate decarboxylase|nr:NAD-dependent epimerase/dehydratase family protein [Faecalibacterium prausnitzii]